MALVQFGDFQFQVSTLVYDELVRVSSVRWASQKVVGGDDRLQAAGRNNDTIRLTGTFHPQIASQVGGTVGTKSIDDLRTMMKEMQPKLLTSASGHSLGYWVMEELEAANSGFAASTGHVPRRQRFSIKLRFYGAKI